MTENEMKFLNKPYKNKVWFLHTERTSKDVIEWIAEKSKNGTFFLEPSKKAMCDTELINKVAKEKSTIHKSELLRYLVANKKYDMLEIHGDEGVGKENNRTRVKYYIELGGRI